jgi:hypothetical protein
MPPTLKEARIILALEAIQNNEKLSLRAAAKLLASKERVETWMMTDRVQFDTMARKQGFGDVIRAMPNEKYLEKLRSGAQGPQDDESQTGESSSVSSSSR